ncbi:MAG: polyol transport system permease protein [Gaiellaceae bacterium]|jgi:sorbitol/mannitol transport system permease protein|nr:polyol transport system permease protein [Gaiellaceae bacterium]
MPKLTHPPRRQRASSATSARPAVAAGPGAEAEAAQRGRRGHFIFLLPALLYLVVMTQVPFVLTLWYSFHRWILTSPELGHKWVGLSNYRYEIYEDPTFRTAVENTVVITASIVGMSLLLGLCFALLLNRRFPLRGVVRSLMIAPFFVMPTVSAVVWKNIFLNPIFGIFGWIESSIGVTRVDWLAIHPQMSIIGMAVWQWAPFMMLILLAGLQGIPEELHEAAQLDGAGLWREFRKITLPMLGPFIEIALLLGVIYILQIFAEIFVATQGGPGTATTTVPFYVYQTISQANDVGAASAEGVLAIVFASVIAALLLRLLSRTFKRQAVG